MLSEREKRAAHYGLNPGSTAAVSNEDDCVPWQSVFKGSPSSAAWKASGVHEGFTVQMDFIQ